jgi:hypothetical protein
MTTSALSTTVQHVLHHLREQETVFATIGDGEETCSPMVKLLSHSLVTYYQIKRLAEGSIR